MDKTTTVTESGEEITAVTVVLMDALSFIRAVANGTNGGTDLEFEDEAAQLEFYQDWAQTFLASRHLVVDLTDRT